MKKKKLFAYVCTDVGSARKINQDNFFLNGVVLEDYYQKNFSYGGAVCEGVFAVADGMGGESYGEYASRTAVEAIRANLSNFTGINDNDVRNCIELANNEICKKISETKEHIGTTIAIAVIQDNAASVYNIGDTKCFLYRQGSVMQLSKDHTLVAQMVDANIITKEEARTDKRRHQLSQHLGIFPEDMALSPYCCQNFVLEKDDIILMCSDGVTDGLSETEIAAIIYQAPSFPSIAEQLVSAAIQNGSRDNATALLIKSVSDSDKELQLILWILTLVGAAAVGVVLGILTLLFLM